MQANEKILRTIQNRTEARGQAADVDGLLAVIAACEQGLEHARRTLAVVAPNHEAEAQKAVEAKMRRELEKAENSNLYQAIIAAGGVAVSSEDVREEYRAVPTSYRRRDGMPGDELAEHLATNHPEFGITDERSLIDYFSNRAARTRNARLAPSNLGAKVTPGVPAMAGTSALGAIAREDA